MSKRAAATEETRRRIIDATRALHNEAGIAATSWDAIADRAGVGVGTVYRHFPTLDELVPACGRVSMEAVALPDPGDAGDLFEGLEGQARIERLVAEVFAVYERGADDIRTVRREPDVHPTVTEFLGAVERLLSALIATALEPLDSDETDARIVRALLDLPVWDSLRQRGVTGDEAVGAIARMLACRLV